MFDIPDRLPLSASRMTGPLDGMGVEVGVGYGVVGKVSGVEVLIGYGVGVGGIGVGVGGIGVGEGVGSWLQPGGAMAETGPYHVLPPSVSISSSL